jgi:hypothetical protein
MNLGLASINSYEELQNLASANSILKDQDIIINSQYMTEQNLKKMSCMIQKSNPDHGPSIIQKGKSGIFHYTDIIEKVHI